uniref:Gustatory receptor n=1 Tax=Timema cristinae TaxID=61476 RepID=A0A7R9H1B0_TIMCR|nr:unnamed protein product [Timema cristinae]
MSDKLVIESTIYSDMKPIFYVSKYLGLAPFRLVGGKDEPYSIECSLFFFVYGVLFLVVLNVGELFFTQGWFEDEDAKSLFKITANYVTLALYFGGMLVHFFTLVNSRKICLIVAKVSKMETFVVKDLKYSKRRIFWFSMMEIFFGIICPFIMTTAISYDPPLFDDLPSSNLTLTDCYFFNVISIAQLQFINFVLKLLESYTSLNYTLKLLKKCPINVTSSHESLRNFEICQFDEIDGTRETSVVYRKHLHVNAAEIIRQLRKLHTVLCDNSELINSAYSFQILICATQHFIGITFIIYSIFVHALNYETSLIESVAWNLITSYWLLWDSLVIIAVAASCTLTTNQANMTGVIVHKLLNEVEDERIKAELELFSLQLLHRKVQFNACARNTRLGGPTDKVVIPTFSDLPVTGRSGLELQASIPREIVVYMYFYLQTNRPHDVVLSTPGYEPMDPGIGSRLVPWKGNYPNGHQGLMLYKKDVRASLAEELLRFQTLQPKLMGLNLERLDDGDGTGFTIKAHKAQWHNNCWLKFNQKAFEEQSHRESTTSQPCQPRTSTMYKVRLEQLPAYRERYSHNQTKEQIAFCDSSPKGTYAEKKHIPDF